MNIAIARLVVVAFSLMYVSVALGQQVPDPFEEQSDDAFIKKSEDSALEQQNLAAQVDEATAIANRQVFDREIAEARRKNEYIIKEFKRVESRYNSISSAHGQLIARLLSSQDEATQIAGLEQVLDCRRDNVPLELDDDITQGMLQLVESETAKIRELSVAALIKYDEKTARDHGYQAGTWFPVRETPEAELIQLKLNSQVSDFDFYESSLSEIIDVLKQNYGFQIDVEKNVSPELELTFKTYQKPLHNALEQLLATKNLTFRIEDRQLLILPIDSIEAITNATYNVRGLLTSQLDIEAIAKVARASLVTAAEEEGREVGVLVLDENRIRVTGTESQQLDIAKSLTSLGQGR